MCNITKDICDDYGFHFLNDVDSPAVQLIAVGRQSRNTESYYWDNSDRQPCFLFQYTLNGSGTLKADGQTYVIDQGKAFFLKMPADEAYYFDSVHNQAPWEFIYIMFQGSCVSPYYEYIVNRTGKVMTLPEYHSAIKLLFDLHHKSKHGFAQDSFTTANDIFSFLCLLCSAVSQNTVQPSRLVSKVQDYLKANYSTPITLAQTAKYFGVSQSHLSREFMKYTNEQPIRYLTKIRLEQAVLLLHSTEMSLDEISSSCGFSDSNYFYKVFKKYMKITPSEFRYQMKEQDYNSVQV